MIRPYVVIFVTQTIDGRIASVDRFSKLSCPEDKRRQYWLRCMVDAVLVGANTVIVDNPRLYPKMCIGSKSRYYRIVVDGALRVPTSARIFDTSEYPTIVLTSSLAPRDKVIELRSKGVDIVIAGSGPVIDMEKAFEVLVSNYGIQSIMVEGGGETIWSIVGPRLFDEYRVTIAPTIFGGRNSVPAVGGQGFKGVEAPKLRLEFAGLCKCLNEIHLVYVNTEARGEPVKKLSLGVLNNFAKVIKVGELIGEPAATTD